MILNNPHAKAIVSIVGKLHASLGFQTDWKGSVKDTNFTFIPNDSGSPLYFNIPNCDAKLEKKK